MHEAFMGDLHLGDIRFQPPCIMLKHVTT